MAIKGAIFLAKSSAVKAAVLKYGSYLIATKGIGATLAAGTTIATAAGYFVTIKSIPEKSYKGFTQLINAMSEGSYADFLDGVYQLSKVYSSTNLLVADFYEFIDASQCDYEVKISLKKSLNGVKSLIENEIEKKSYSVLKEFESMLQKKNMSSDDYTKRIQSIYVKHTFNLKDDYSELLGRGGRIYSEISDLNKSIFFDKNESSSKSEYDHYLVYCIAGWFIDNLKLECLNRIYSSDKTIMQKRLARDITDQILAYLKAYKLN